MLIDKIKADIKSAIKSRDVNKKVILVLLINEVNLLSSMDDNKVPDYIVYHAINKQITRLDSSIYFLEQNQQNLKNSSFLQNQTKYNNYIIQRDILKKYLFLSLTEVQIRDKIASLVKSIQISDFLEFKKNLFEYFSGTVGPDIISKILDEMLVHKNKEAD